MNKTELVEHILEAEISSTLTKAEAGKLVDEVFKAITKSVVEGNDFSMPGFGKFAASERAARDGRNPQTGETIKISASKAVKFSPALAFKQLLNPKAAEGAKATSKK
ncbi:MAG: HU family DNA-binding protein [Janthinobacterium lividum]